MSVTARGSWLLVVLAVLGSASVANAAILAGGRFGVSVASISGDVNSTFDKANRTGFAGTGFAQIGVAGLAIQPEISYLQKGVKDNTTGDKLDINYLEVAALAKYGFPLVAVEPHVFAGVGADFEVNKKTPTSFDTENMDWNAIFGADVMVNLGGLALVGDGRFALGLKDVSTASGSNLKNRAWLFSAGIAKSF